MHPIRQKILALVRQEGIIELSLRRLGETVGTPHPQEVKHHLLQLEKNGLITMKRPTRNKLQLFSTEKTPHYDESNPMRRIPVLHTSAFTNEELFFSEENISGYLTVSRRLLGEKYPYFALRVEDNGMNKTDFQGKTIEEGDFVFFTPAATEHCHDGMYVVILYEGIAKVKKIITHNDDGYLTLVSESTRDILPMFLHQDDHRFIKGIVEKVMKRPKKILKTLTEDRKPVEKIEES